MATLVLSLPLGGILIIGAIPKLRRPRGFVLTVWEYRVLPRRAAVAYALIVPVAELLLGLVLLSGATVRPSAIASAVLLGTFTVAVAVNAAQGRVLDCGCFGPWFRRTVGWPLVAQDALLTLACVADAVLARPGLASWSIWVTSASPFDSEGLGVAVCAVAAVLVVAALHGPTLLAARTRSGAVPTIR